MLRIRASKPIWSDCVEILALKREDGKSYSATGFTYQEYNDGYFLTPTFVLSNSEAQELMDSLWQCGLRPTEGSGSAGSLAATERHLEDMQKIAFSAFNKLIDK